MSIVYKRKMSMNNFYNKNGMHNLTKIFKRQKQFGKTHKDSARYLGIDYRSVSRHCKQKSIGLDLL